MTTSLPHNSLKFLTRLFLYLIISAIFLPTHTTVLAATKNTTTDQTILLEVNPNENPLRSKIPLSYQLKPTKSLEDILTIKNYSPEQNYHLKLYAVDAKQSTDGAVAFDLNREEKNQIGQWITFGSPEMVVPAGQTVYLPYRIQVPENTPPGAYQGGLVAELISTQTSNTPGDIRIVPRLIESVIVNVPGRKILNYQLDSFQYLNSGKTPSFLLKFSNGGNMMLRAEGTLQISGTLLPEPYQMSLNHATILQGERLEKTLPFNNPPLLGSYQAVLIFEIYEYNSITAQPVYLSTIRQELHFLIIPWDLLIGILIALIVIYISYKYGRNWLNSRQLDTFTHRVKAGETILSIAKLYRLDWQTIAKINKLEKPYTLGSGDILELPFPTTKKPSKPKSKSHRQP